MVVYKGTCPHLLLLFPTYGYFNLSIDESRTLAICDWCEVPPNFPSNPATLVPAEDLPVQQEVLAKRLLRLNATFPEMARGLIVAYRELMKSVDADTGLAHAFRALDELARHPTGNNKGPRSTHGVFGEGEYTVGHSGAYLDSVLSARIQIRCDPLVSLVG